MAGAYREMIGDPIDMVYSAFLYDLGYRLASELERSGLTTSEVAGHLGVPEHVLNGLLDMSISPDFASLARIQGFVRSDTSGF